MKLVVALAVVLFSTSTFAFGQGMPGAKPNPALGQTARLFGKTGGFSATGHMSSLAADGEETITPMEYAMRDGAVRMEIDLAKTQTLRKGKPVKKRGDDTEEMTQMGLNKQVTLIRPDPQAACLMYPGLKAYCELPKSTTTPTTPADSSKTEWKEEGRETIDGHPCVKYLVTTTNADGTTETATAWKATDLKDFVIQTVTVADGETTTLKFTNVKFDKPAATLFEIPADYKKYGSMQELMMGSMQQMMQNMGDQ